VIDIETFLALVNNLQILHRNWRIGQTYWNAARLLGFDVPAGTDFDPFYSDARCAAFLRFLIEQGFVIR
jgi:hypothetical protein